MKACDSGSRNAAAVGDAVLGEPFAEAAAGEGGSVVGAEREAARFDRSYRDSVVDERDRLVGTATQLERPADDLTRAAIDRGVQVGPAVLGDPDARHVEVPELVGPLASLSYTRETRVAFPPNCDTVDASWHGRQ